MHKIETASIIENQEITRGIFKLRLGLPLDYPRPEPGQFVNIYLNDSSRLLPRPISVCDFAKGTLTLVYAVAGAGTEIISGYKAGAAMRVSTPLGNGFSISIKGNCVLVGGGAGVPPLLFWGKQLNGQLPVRAFLGFKSEPFLTNEFPCDTEIATDDGSSGFKGNVINLLERTEIPDDTQIFACGPRPMLKSLAGFAKERGLALQVSLEERMGCGYGACVGCVCKTTAGSRKVCEDGPVFNASEVIWHE